ncbi:RNA demethylase ALKBH10B [Malania oleifera]|uniref:RNA demethylase ALKBH10B n=1 Tax=Malania oleifera TaxID=397392 RepID=UPI0025AE7352|nr:RNA demethylase ALKBH10B [Malania oleifera]
MPTAAGPASPSDRASVMMPMPAQSQAQAQAQAQPQPQVQPTMLSEAFAKDAIIAWFRGEFAAANAIIDVLCNHLAQLTAAAAGRGSEYESVFEAIHRRRLNWIPVLQMQKYHSIADVALELRRVAANKGNAVGNGEGAKKNEEAKEVKEVHVSSNEEENETGEESGEPPNGKSMESNGEVVNDHFARDDAPESEISDAGSQSQPTLENTQICSNHEDCGARSARIKLTKGFVAKEPVKGHMVNVLKGLKLYEDVFAESELSKLTDFVNELRVAGQNGELSGETFILFNKQMKGNKRELIQLGIPIFGQIREEETSIHQKSNIEPIPAFLQGVIDHLILWQLIPDYKKPNSCIINFFDEGEYSQPFLKPPHLDQPISTLLLSESTMAFGRTLVSDSDGNFKGPLMLSLKEGSLLVLRGNSADMARHVMCPSPIKRVSITFFRVRPESNQSRSPTTPPLTTAMTVWQPGVPNPQTMPNGVANGYETMDLIPKWGVLRAPVVMLAPMRPMVLSPRRIPHGGTGVFLPWTVGSRKPAKHLPPRAQKGRFLALPPPVETRVAEPTSDSSISV